MWGPEVTGPAAILPGTNRCGLQRATHDCHCHLQLLHPVNKIRLKFGFILKFSPAPQQQPRVCMTTHTRFSVFFHKIHQQILFRAKKSSLPSLHLHNARCHKSRSVCFCAQRCFSDSFSLIESVPVPLPHPSHPPGNRLRRCPPDEPGTPHWTRTGTSPWSPGPGAIPLLSTLICQTAQKGPRTLLSLQQSRQNLLSPIWSSFCHEWYFNLTKGERTLKETPPACDISSSSMSSSVQPVGNTRRAKHMKSWGNRKQQKQRWHTQTHQSTREANTPLRLSRKKIWFLNPMRTSPAPLRKQAEQSESSSKNSDTKVLWSSQIFTLPSSLQQTTKDTSFSPWEPSLKFQGLICSARGSPGSEEQPQRCTIIHGSNSCTVVELLFGSLSRFTGNWCCKWMTPLKERMNQLRVVNLISYWIRNRIQSGDLHLVVCAWRTGTSYDCVRSCTCTAPLSYPVIEVVPWKNKLPLFSNWLDSWVILAERRKVAQKAVNMSFKHAGATCVGNCCLHHKIQKYKRVRWSHFSYALQSRFFVSSLTILAKATTSGSVWSSYCSSKSGSDQILKQLLSPIRLLDCATKLLCTMSYRIHTTWNRKCWRNFNKVNAKFTEWS